MKCAQVGSGTSFWRFFPAKVYVDSVERACFKIFHTSWLVVPPPLSPAAPSPSALKAVFPWRKKKLNPGEWSRFGVAAGR